MNKASYLFILEKQFLNVKTVVQIHVVFSKLQSLKSLYLKSNAYFVFSQLPSGLGRGYFFLL